MSKPWQGAARRLTDADFTIAARDLGADLAAIRAVWDVESAGRPFRADGSLERRYEPHHFPGSGITDWRESLKLPQVRREAMFGTAYGRNAEAAMRATSWGGPQIMGFNHAACGFSSARAMVAAMAEGEQAQLAAFIGFLRSKGLVGALQRHD
ncbi:MAG: N-acetylmuramidase domain-containing protein [Paracoccus sp. (in: a-proteobacteria)]|nr:N-acetylmuramidase domain-containing protein [Paracoccus sp. (in: a-proteobacteria)]